MSFPRRIFLLAALFLAFLSPAPSPAQSITFPQFGPAKGTLIIIGGGGKSQAIIQRFIQTAGGPDASLVAIPTADDQDDKGDRIAAFLRKAGSNNVTVLHTRDPKVADTEEFVKPLLTAQGVWLGGGRQWRMADAYLGTRVVKELFAVLERGGVIAGSSAGATIQGSYLVRGAPEGNTVMMAPGHEVGFGFLKGSAIDQHWATRKRERDLVPVIERFPDLLGIGLDEDTAIIVQGDRFEVMGRGPVGIYDAKSSAWKTETPWLTLHGGATFDIKTRSVVK
jgi:cyanophycinase